MATDKNKKISVIIPNLNGRNFLIPCLASLRQQNFQDFELIIVDNGSSDDSITIIKREFPEATIYNFTKNEGFSRAINQGISLSTGEYIFLLNNDTELDINCLKVLNNFLDNNPQAGFGATKMLFFNNHEIINNTGDIFSKYGLASKRGWQEKDNGQYNKPEPIFGACAGGAIYRKILFDEVGKFDEDFFAYLEDIDFSFRAQIRGYKCWYIPQAIVYHVDGGTSLKNKKNVDYLMVRNSLFVIFKNFPTSWLIMFSPFILLNQIKNILSGLKHHYLKLVFRGYGEFIKKLPKLYRKRKGIQKNCYVTKKYLLSIISKKYPFPIKKNIYEFFFRHR